MIDLEKVKVVHFVGIGGIGVSAIARLFLSWGKRVSGSDLSLETPVIEGMQKAGALIFSGQRGGQIPADCELLIYSNAVAEDNPELAAASGRGIPTLSYPEVLGLISKGKFTIAVAGTHGKTTTTAMLAKIMLDNQLDPTVIVGSLIGAEQSNLIIGESHYFLVEADEYKRAFLNLSPKLLVITNIAADHLDYYRDLVDIQSAFAELTKRSEKVIRQEDYERIKLPIKLPIFGAHNQANAQAAIAAACALGVAERASRHALEDFLAPWRRFEFKGETAAGALVYDDYAHNPDKIRAVLAGAHEQFPGRKIIALFQPHLYSRTKLLFSELTDSLTSADQVGLLPIYPARESFDPSIKTEDLLAAINKKGGSAVYLKDFSMAEKWLAKSACRGDIVITIGAGDIFALAKRLVYNQTHG